MREREEGLVGDPCWREYKYNSQSRQHGGTNVVVDINLLKRDGVRVRVDVWGEAGLCHFLLCVPWEGGVELLVPLCLSPDIKTSSDHTG